MNQIVQQIEKTKGGQITEDGKWLVLTESTPIVKHGELKGYKHNQCGETVMAFIDHRPIWDGPFPCSGSGQVRRETVPYCPKCEEKPATLGPIDLRHALWGNIGD